MSGVTHKIEEAVKALEQGRVKKALYLTDTDKTERHHKIVTDAARKCLTDKGKCPAYLKDAAQKLQETITAPLDTTDLEGVEEMVGASKQIEEEKPKAEADEYENCEECHIADAAVKFHDISKHCGDSITQRLEKIADEQDTPPEAWLKSMIEIAEGASCGREQYETVLGELSDYLEKRQSPILKKLDKEKRDA